jgi:hypothetical protein
MTFAIPAAGCGLPPVPENSRALEVDRLIKALQTFL